MNIWNYEVSLAEALWGLVAQRVGVWQVQTLGCGEQRRLSCGPRARTIVFGTHRGL